MINKKHGLGPQGINAIKQAKEIWDNPPKTLEIKENPAKKLKSMISSSVFNALERDRNVVTDLINRLKKQLENFQRVKIELGTKYASYDKVGDDPFLKEISTFLLSRDSFNQNTKVWQDLMKILKTSFPNYQIEANWDDEFATVYEIIIEKQ